MYSFTHYQPESLPKAIGAASDDAKFLAGGMTLIPTMKQRLAAPGTLIDLDRLDELRGIEVAAGFVTIGAMTKHHDVASSNDVQQVFPALAFLAGAIGDPAVRNRGTIGGSTANNDPAADYPSAELATNATIVTNRREIKADEYFVGLFETALQDSEMIIKVRFPIPERAAYEKFRNPASRYAIVGAFVAKTGSDVRVAVTGAGSNGVFRVQSFEEALAKDFSLNAIEDIAVPQDGLNADMHADAEYRAHLIGVMTRRAVVKALGA